MTVTNGVDHLRTGDTAPRRYQLVNETGGAIDLTAATAVRIRAQDTTGATVVDDPVTIVLPATVGTVEWDQDPALPAGRYHAAFPIVWNTGDSDTWPDSGHLTLVVEGVPAALP